MNLVELSKEHNIAISTLNNQINKKKEIKVSDYEIMTKQEIIDMKKEMARIKEENEIVHQRRANNIINLRKNKKVLHYGKQ